MDAVLFTDLVEFAAERTYIDGQCVAAGGQCLVPSAPATAINNFNATKISEADLAVPAEGIETMRVIGALDGELVTSELHDKPVIVDGVIEADAGRDILQLVVLNRYRSAAPASAFVHGFNLQRGAIASTVAHDSHNIIAVGTSRAETARAINAVIDAGGGVAVCDGDSVELLPLPVAGLMSLESGETVAARYAELDRAAKTLGSKLRAPFMTLSFMALLVIPELKLSDKGLFDGKRFQFVPLAL
jgi:adenine deaminase